jgi:hypothetical protein
MITFILYRPSDVIVTLGMLDEYSESALTIQEFLDYEALIMCNWLQEKFYDDLLLFEREDFHRPIQVITLVDGVLLAKGKQNMHCDIEAIIREARANAQAAFDTAKEQEPTPEMGVMRLRARVRELAAKCHMTLEDAGISIKG